MPRRCDGDGAPRTDKAATGPGTVRTVALCVAFIIMQAASSMLGVDIAQAQSCAIGTGSGSFGNVTILSGAADDSSSTFSVTCTGTANQTVRLCIDWGAGNSPDGAGNRMMYSSSNTMRLDFFTTSSYTTIWGSWGSSSLEAYTPYPYGVQQDLALGSSGSNSATLTVYGQVYANQQTAPPGSYSWTSGGSPSLQYGYAAGTSCPVGSKTTSSSGSTWTATVLANANLSVTSMNFGSNSSFILANIQTTAVITVQSTNTTPYSIGLDNGQNASGSQRRMSGGGGNYVSYGLYTDAAYSHAWTSTTSTTSCTGGASTCVLGTGTGSNQNVTVYGQVPPQTAPATGTYTDTVVVTVTF